MKRGRVGPYLRKLVSELRVAMYPYTAINLKESKVNSIKDFLSIVDVYGLSHMLMVTKTDKRSYLRLAKMPRGPTITFRLEDYCLGADLFDHNVNTLKRNGKPLTKSCNHMPLVIMNGFNSSKITEEYIEPVKIAGMLIQSFFPPINLNEIQLKKCKRVMLFNLNFEKDENGNNIPLVEFRHFDIDIEKYSIKKTISNIINFKKTDLSNFQNISDYILKQSGYTSQSDNEDPNAGLCSIIKDEEIKEEAKCNKENDEEKDKIKVKLYELGPRLNLQIHKIEEGFLKGNVMFHSLLKKSKKEIKETMNSIKEKKRIKKERKMQQEENISKKKEGMTEEQKLKAKEGKIIV
jgi:ribosome biogenesis protein SSF1/2